MTPPNVKTPGAGGRAGAADFVTTLDAQSVPHSIADAQRRRLPGYGRAVRANLLAGTRPKIGGGCACVVTDWEIRTPLVQMVCEPSVPVTSWNLGFLAGVEILLLIRAGHAAYGQALLDALLDAGSPLVSLHVVPEADDGR